MRTPLVHLLLCSILLVAPGRAFAAANAGGVLWVHTNDSVVYTSDQSTYASGLECQPWQAPCPPFTLGCAANQAGVNPTSGVHDVRALVCWVMAAWPEQSCPSLKGITFGIDYDPDSFALVKWGSLANFELASPSWPSPRTGTAVTWNGTMRSHLKEVYWFAGYAYAGNPGTFDLIPHPQQGGDFIDDSVPGQLDPIGGFGRLGLGGASGTNPPLGQGFLPPNIVVTPLDLDFGTVGLGSAYERSLRVQNTGEVPLQVTAVTTQHAEFTVDATHFTLPPGADRFFRVRFTPSQSGAIDDVCTIESDDPDEMEVHVVLHGVGDTAPQLNAVPNSFTFQLSSGGVADTTLMLSNLGASDLHWQLWAVPASGQSSLLQTHVLWDASHGGFQDVNLWGQILGELRARGATIDLNGLPITSQILSPYDMVWISDPIEPWDPNEIAALASFVGEGGSLLIETGDPRSEWVVSAILTSVGAGLRCATPGALPGSSSEIEAHYTTNGVHTLFLQGQTLRIELAEEAGQPLARDDAGTLFAAYSLVGSGRVLCVADELFDNPHLSHEDNGLFAHQVFSWLAGTPWIETHPTRGALASGGNDTIELKLDSHGLGGGDYLAEVQIASDDPATPVMQVPITLTVSGAADIDVTPPAFDFGLVVVGQIASTGLLVRNVGPDPLEVSGLTCDRAEFLFDPAGFVVEAAGEHMVIVTFQPNTEGPVDGTLQFASNDPDEPTLAVPLHGRGGAPPVLGVTPDSLAVQLFSNGSTTRTLALRNLGGSDLTFNLTIDPIGGTKSHPVAVEPAATAMAERRTGWLSVDPYGGIIPPGDSTIVQVDFDANELNDGDYSAVITIYSDDPEKPAQPVPVHLHVTGAADLTLSETQLNFRVTFVGYSSTESLIARNTGTATLHVNSVSCDSPEFRADSTGFSLAPGEETSIEVVFAPAGEGTRTGILTVASDDPDAPTTTVSLLGEGLFPPDISVSPDSLSAELFVGGTDTQTLTLRNEGPSVLGWTLQVFERGTEALRYTLPMPTSARFTNEAGQSPPSTEARTSALTLRARDLTGKRILFDFGHSYGYSGEWSGMIADLAMRGAEIQVESVPLTSDYLSQFDMLWSPDAYFVFSQVEIDALVEFLRQGKGWLIESDEGGPAFNPILAALHSGLEMDAPPGSSGPSTIIQPHPTTLGVQEIWFSGPVTGIARIASPAGELVQSSDHRAQIAYSLPGAGRVVLIEDEILIDGALYRSDNELFGNQLFDWLVGPSWLHVEPTSGTIAPGAYVEADATFDATRVLGGSYRAVIRVVSNDPDETIVDVPAHLHVIGAPDIELSETTLAFPTTFVTGESHDSLRVRNTGTDLLVVSAISVDAPEWTANADSFALAPGSERVLDLRFAPLAPGSYSGVLSILSNDPDEPLLTVALSGDAILPPDIAVSPDSLFADLLSGEEESQPITIANQGASDLVWSARAGRQVERRSYTFAPPPARSLRNEAGDEVSAEPRREIPLRATLRDLTGARVLWDASHGQITPQYWSQMVQDLVARGATVDVNYLPMSAALLAAYDVLWCVDAVTFQPDEVQAVADFVTEGGGLLIESDQGEPAYNPILEAAGSGLQMGGSAGYSGISYSVYPHPSTEDVSAIYLSGPVSGIYSITEPAGRLADSSDGRPQIAWSTPGSGRIVLIEDEVLLDGAIEVADNELFGNQVFDWLVGETWLDVTPSAGVIPAGDAREIQANFHTEGLIGGEYGARIDVRSNDPDEPTTSVAVHLHVTGAPNIAVSDSLLVYPTTFVGGETRDSLLVRNRGTDLLRVTSLSIDLPEWTADIDSFSLDPAQSRVVTIIFRPSEPSAYQGQLTIVCNDPDQPTVQVALRGDALLPPDIAVTPDSLFADLFTGASAERVITIANEGVTELTWTTQIFASDQPSRRTFTLAPPAGQLRPNEGGEMPPVAGAQTTPLRAQLRDLTGKRVLWDRAHSQYDLGTWSEMVADLETRGAAVDVNWETITPELLSGYEVLWSSDALGFAQAEVLAIEEFVRGGGGLLIESDEGMEAFNPILTDLGTGLEMGAAAGTSGPTTFIYPHAITEGVTSIRFSGPVSGIARIDSPAGRLVDANNGIPQIAYSTAQFGRVVLIEDEVLTNGDLEQEDNELFGNQVFDWLITPGWLRVEPSAGSIAPGEVMPLTAHFNATGLYGGAYFAEIHFRSNDPDESDVPVHAQLQVTGAPDIAVSDSLLAYPTTFVGSESLDSLLVMNRGTDLLTVTEILIDTEEWDTDAGSFSIAPGDRRSVPIAFHPFAPGPITGTLSIASDDPDQPLIEIGLQGEGLLPPDIAVTPDSLFADLFTGGTQVDSITIANNGASDLIWSSRVVARSTGARQIYRLPVPEAHAGTNEANEPWATAPVRTDPLLADLHDLTGVRILWDAWHGQGSSYYYHSAFANDLLSRGATITENFQDLTTVELWEYDLLYTSDCYGFSSMEYSAVVSFVRDGGALLIESDEAGSTLNPILDALGSGLEMDGIAGAGGTTTRIYAHPTTEGVHSIYFTGPVTGLARVTAPAALLVESSDGRPQIGASAVANGRVIVIEDEVLYDGPYGSGDNQLFGQQVVDWLTEPTWISIEPPGGVLPAGDEVRVPATFNAAQLLGGDYHAVLHIDSNDPDEPDWPIAAHLHVTGAPIISVEPDSLVFPETFLGESAEEQLLVKNVGTDLLVVTSIAFDSGEWSADVDSFTLAPAKIDTLLVRFHPQAPGDRTGSLTFTSNAPSTPYFTVPLSGSALPPPNLVVYPDSLGATAYRGDQVARSVTIANTGESQLTFAIHPRSDDPRVGLRMVTPPDPRFTVHHGPGYEGDAAPTRPVPRPEELNHGVAHAGTLRLAVLFSGGDPVWFASQLASFPDFDAIDLFDIQYSNPTLDQLLEYHTAILLVSYPPGNASQLGDVLADFVDAGHGVVLTLASFISQWSVTGRFASEGYMPFVDGYGPVGSSSLGDYDAAHPIMEGVQSASGDMLATANLASGARWVASWATGWPCVATQREQVVGVNAFVAYSGYVQGDVPLLLRNACRWSASVPDWIDLSPNEGVLEPGESRDIAVTLNATKLDPGDYRAHLEIESNDPTDGDAEISVRLGVLPGPNLSVRPDSLIFPTIFVGSSALDSVSLSNLGSDPLEVSSITTSAVDFAVNSDPFVLTPGESRSLFVNFTPTHDGAISGFLSVNSNDPDQPSAIVALSGAALYPPELYLAPDTLVASAMEGDSTTTQLIIANTGRSTLDWAIEPTSVEDGRLLAHMPPVSSGLPPRKAKVEGPDPTPSSRGMLAQCRPAGVPGEQSTPTPGMAPSLEQFLARLDERSAEVTEAIPSRYDFQEGESGLSIGDGGYDMYDGGNILGTNWWYGIPYSDGVISDGTYFGPTGRYFTKKYPGLFVLAADLDQVSDFAIDGNLGADGAGYADGTMLEVTSSGATYRGYVKRVWAAGDPSVNHLVVVERGSDLNFEYATYTDSDYQRLWGLNGYTRIYYLLYAGLDGSYIDDNATLQIFERFVDVIRAAPQWMAVDRVSGSLGARTSDDDVLRHVITVSLSASNLTAGTYRAALEVRSNDPTAPFTLVPVRFEVTGAMAGPTDVTQDSALPTAFALYPSIPNPARGSASIRFDVPHMSPLSLAVFDLTGRRVRSLRSGIQAAGRAMVIWDGRDDRGRQLATGVYFYRLEAEHFRANRRLLWIR